MPRFRPKSSIKERPTRQAPKKKNKKTSSKSNSPKGKDAKSKSGPSSSNDVHSQRKRGVLIADRPALRSDEAVGSVHLYSDILRPDPEVTWTLRSEQDLASLQQPSFSRPVARAEKFDPTLPLISLSSATSSSSTSSPTSTKVTNPTASLRHNTPLILCIVIGAVVVTATLSVGLAWVLRLVCCASGRKDRRKRRLDCSTWSPSSLAAAEVGKEQEGKTSDRKSLESVIVSGGGDDPEDKKAKIDAFLADMTSGGTVPLLSYADPGKTQEVPKSTWNGKGWTLFDPPVASVQPPEPAAAVEPAPGARGGNYGAAKEELADRDIEGFTWPSSIERQPSFIERLVQRHHRAAELPISAPLPYPFEAKPPQTASRMASLGGAANRAMLNILPPTLRDAATTASRQRATRKRYNDMQPYLDSDFEGTIGAKDRELPMARRLQHAEERMAVDWTTEEESMSPLQKGPKAAGQFGNHLQQPRVQPVMVPSPVIIAEAKAPIEFTPGLAGIGAAWSRRGSQQSSLIGRHAPILVRSSLATVQLPKTLEPNRVTMLPFPALEGDRRGRLLGSVGRWLGQVTEAGEIADPYTAPSPRPDRRLTKNGSLRSDYTSTTLADSAASSSSTQVEARTSASASGKSERLLQRVDADQVEHDRQQRRLLRKARMFTPAKDSVAQQDESQQGASAPVVGNNLSRTPSIRPQFCATTDLKSWLEPGKVSTTHGLKALEEQDAPSIVAADPFSSDAEAVPRLKKCESYSSFASEARPIKTKLRSSNSKQRLRSAAAVANVRTTAKDASRRKREALRSLTANTAKKANNDIPLSACHSSAAITVASSIFDEAFAAQLKVAAGRKRAAKEAESKQSRQAFRHGDNTEAKAKAKTEADAAVRDAWRRRKLLSISSRGSQRSRTARSTRTQTQETGAPLSREESLRSQPSIYSELTAPSDYKYQAPLLSDSTRETMLTSCSASTADPISEDLPDLEEVLSPKAMVASTREEEEWLKKQLKKEAKKAAKRQQRRAERQQAKEDAAAKASVAAADQAHSQDVTLSAVWTRGASAGPTVPKTKGTKARAVSSASASTATKPKLPLGEIADADPLIQQLAVRHTIKQQRSISLGAARTQFAIAAASVDDAAVPDSPWTSSDSDISIRRWGAPRRDDSFRLQNQGHRNLNSSSSLAETAMVDTDSQDKRATAEYARANSYYFGMGAGGDLRDFC